MIWLVNWVCHTGPQSCVIHHSLSDQAGGCWEGSLAPLSLSRLGALSSLERGGESSLLDISLIVLSMISLLPMSTIRLWPLISFKTRNFNTFHFLFSFQSLIRTKLIDLGQV